MSRQINVAIIGAGLGGLTAALALRQRGIQVQVYEQAKVLRAVGAGLTLFPNGLRMLEAIAPHVLTRLKAIGAEIRKVNLYRETGELMTETRVALAEMYGQPMLNFRWSRLQECLADGLPPECLHFDHRCVGFTQDEDSVTIHFEGGQEVQADLLVGADGINSVVRQRLIGKDDRRYAGRLSWRALVEHGRDWHPAHEATMILGADGKTFSLFDVSDGYLFWSAGLLSPDNSRSPDATKAKARTQAIFEGWGDLVERLIAATPAEQIIERPIMDLPPLSRWSDGRVTLLGDAAHAMVPALGQGANTAFEDAWELAYYLTLHPTIADALASYDKHRILRTQLIQARSGLMGSRSYDTDSQNFLRETTEKAWSSQSEFEDWLYGYQPVGMVG